jgi:transcriptional regulator GlxA family with amidase domain
VDAGSDTVFPGFQILDATGPIAAFEIAERYRPGTHDLRTVAVVPGPIPSSSGACLQASSRGRAEAVDTLVVAGGEGSREAAVCGRTLKFVLACAARSRRVASVCSGTYVLAAAGLLDGRRATTHWSVTADFSRRFPKVRLDADRIYVRDGKIWSSAGITAGIDLALALIGEDLGEDIARRTAQQLVVYHRSPGGPS